MRTIYDLPKYDGIEATAEEYYELPDDGFRYELIDGRLLLAPSPLERHQRLLFQLTFRIANYLNSNPIGIAYFAPLDVELTKDFVCQPDIIFIRNENRRIITEKRIVGAPDLLVEILSEGTAQRDREVKFKRYAQYGVKEYWIIDPKTADCKFYKLIGDAFNEVSPKSNIYTSEILTGFELNLDDVRKWLQG